MKQAKSFYRADRNCLAGSNPSAVIMGRKCETERRIRSTYISRFDLDRFTGHVLIDGGLLSLFVDGAELVVAMLIR